MERLIITITGCVQGVGFRPFVYRLAQKYDIRGSISNTTSGVVIEAQGEGEALALFQKELVLEKPKGAKISEMNVQKTFLGEATCFKIKTSSSETDTALALLPDTAICQQCLKELFDPANRRFLYPFLHCITCGPRFSLFLSMPFDRANTTMIDFSMCRECMKEYDDPENRRFYSQTNCCPKCGPELQLLNSKGECLAAKQEAISAAVRLLQQGKIVAMKNTGGYQLLVDAASDLSVKRLRLLKHRAGKPFALLMPGMTQINQIAHVCQTTEQVLTSTAAPIVLVKKRDAIHDIAPSVAGDSPYYGIMLAHNAMQHLLLKEFNGALIATSGNISGSPLCITEEEAFLHLSPIADAFLVHNRRINHRLDDSIVHIIANQPVILRRARGYTPYAIELPKHMGNHSKPAFFAAGSQQKNAFAFTKKNQIYISQHIGDLEAAKTCKAYDQEVQKWEQLLALEPSEGVGDKHPEYYTSCYLQLRKIKTASIQHHEAHVWAGMADNQLHPPFLGIAWDGTGFGDDRTIWGGEAFAVSTDGIQRIASLFPFKLPGGEKAVREPRRACLGLLFALGNGRLSASCEQRLNEMFNQEEMGVLLSTLKKSIHAPVCSSIGRLFDAASALLEFCEISHFEGHAAMMLESAAQKVECASVCYRNALLKENGLWLIDWRPMLRQIILDSAVEDVKAMQNSEIAWAFHEALAQSIIDIAEIGGREKVLLTGGVMQNKLLAEMAIAKLQKAGFTPYFHRNIPPNDGGLAVGQAIGRLYSKG